ncbi:ROK family transcriptional regulator [uncultured Roseibium sp.]|uniref:ROK family transcriptional regulator n=1 Tax=uncultured Roseibium sp. TaxID=1936171 RepID=UPI002621F88E|nr:ROK family transcriptional regulator [uncultured Roseibium sp.]
MTMGLDLGFNSRRIIACVRTSGPQSRADLARRLGVNPATVTRLTTAMVEGGILYEESDPGREGKKGFPAKVLKIEPTGLYSAGVYLDPDKIRTCVINAAGDIITNDEIAPADLTFESIMTAAGSRVREQIGDCGLDNSRVAGCGVSYPGQYTENPSRVRRIQQFKDWPNISIERDLEPYFNMPVKHMNDAKAACLAELYHGVCTDVEDFCYIWLSYGIGGGAVVRGNPHLGRLKGAAEWGGLFPKTKPRPSGQDLFDTLATAGNPIEKLSDIGQEHLGLPVVQAWRERAAQQIQWLCLVIARTFDPETIVVGGTMHPDILDGFIDYMMKGNGLGDDYEWSLPNIVRASRDDLPELGAAALPIHDVTNPTAYAGRASKGW